MLGYCMECKKLCPIQGRTPKIPNPRNPDARDYYPEAHEARDEDNNILLDEEGKTIWCRGAKRAII